MRLLKAVQNSGQRPVRPLAAFRPAAQASPAALQRAAPLMTPRTQAVAADYLIERGVGRVFRKTMQEQFQNTCL